MASSKSSSFLEKPIASRHVPLAGLTCCSSAATRFCKSDNCCSINCVLMRSTVPSRFSFRNLGEVEVLTDTATETLSAGTVFCDDLSTERRSTGALGDRL